jgi:hypothetical protein
MQFGESQNNCTKYVFPINSCPVQIGNVLEPVNSDPLWGMGVVCILLYTVVQWLWNRLIPYVGKPTTCLKDSSRDNFVRSE